MGKFVFNRKWLSDAKFSWVKQFKGDKHKAMCSVCYNIVNRGEWLGSSANIKGANKAAKNLGWKVHYRAQSFVLRSYTMHELRNQHVSIG